MENYSKKNLVFILLIIITFTVLGYANSLVNISVYVDNNFLKLKTNKTTVLDVLKSANISLSEDDIVRPTPNTKLQDDMFIRIYRVTKRKIQQRREIPYHTYHKYTSKLLVGKTIVKQYGRNGVKEIIAQRICVDGEKIKDYITEEKIITNPINCILLKGRRKTLSSLTPNTNMRVKKVLTMIASGYSDSVISCGKWVGHLTSIGLKPQYGIIAVDPRVIPLRTKLYIEGYGYGIAGDVGGAIKGDRIDLCFNTHREAVNYGRKKVKVYILE